MAILHWPGNGLEYVKNSGKRELTLTPHHGMRAWIDPAMRSGLALLRENPAE